jgi:hypothetical protein
MVFPIVGAFQRTSEPQNELVLTAADVSVMASVIARDMIGVNVRLRNAKVILLLLMRRKSPN